MWAQSGSVLRRSPCRRPLPAYSIASSTRSVSVAGNGQPSSAAAARSRVSATVLRARLSDRAICRSLAPPCFRRRISRTRRIDTLSAGIGPPLVVPDEQSAVHRPVVEHLPPLPGWPTSDRNGRDQSGISGRLHPGIGGRLRPEYAITAKHGRTMEELGTISGALSLLANIVMAWNTHRIQAMIDASPGDHPDEVMRRLAPIGHKHINMRGILSFDLAGHRSSLLRQTPAAPVQCVPGRKS